MRVMFRRIPVVLLGLSFVASGLLKGIDPYGTALKLLEYFRVWGWGGFVSGYPQAWSVCLCAGELWLGLLLLSGVFRRLSAWLALAVMAVFTAVAGWLAFSPGGGAVTDCGCFGEAFTLSHGATLVKNVALLALAAFAAWLARGEEWIPRRWNGKWTALCCAALACGIPAYSAVCLPPADFLPYNRGASLPGRGAGSGLETYYADEVTLKSLVRAEAGLIVVEDGVVRAKRNLQGFRPEHFGRPVSVEQLVEEDDGLPYRYAGCVAAALFLTVIVRRREGAA